MHLNPEEKRALDHGHAIPLTIDGTPCVVMKREVYERGQALLDWTPEEMDILAAEAAERLDHSEPIQ